MRELQLIIIAAIISVLVGGGLYLVAGDNSPFNSEYSPRFRTVDISTTGPTGVLAERKNYIFRDEDDFIAFWELVHGNDPAAKRPPVIAFERDQVIAVMAGLKPTGGHSVLITDVVDTPGERIVYIENVSPGEGCFATQAQTNPYHVIAVKRTEKVLRAVESTVQEDCN